MWRIVVGVWRRIVAFVDDALPMPTDQRQARDRGGEPGSAESEPRTLRLKLHMLGKRGKGGYR